MPRKRGKHWYTDFYYDDAEGKRYRHRKLIRGARSRYDATQAEAKIQKEVFQGIYGTPVLKDKDLKLFIAEDFLPWVEHNRERKRDYQRITEIWSELPSLAGKSLREVTQFDIESAKVHRLRTKSQKGTLIKPRTVWKELIFIASLFTRAREWGYVNENPCRGVRVQGIEDAPPRILTGEEEEKLVPFLKDCEARWLYPFIVVALSVGLRPNEVCSLRKAKIDIEKGMLWPTKTKSPKDPRIKKGVPLNSFVIEILKEWLAQTRSEWVFPSPKDSKKHITYGVASVRFREVQIKAGIRPTVGLHKLRHTFGTRLAEQDVRIEHIQELMGHTDIRTTRIYVHPSLDVKRDAVERLVPEKSQRVVELNKQRAG